MKKKKTPKIPAQKETNQKQKKLNSGRWRSHSAFQASYLSKTPILQDISHTQNQHQVAFCVYWDHTRFVPISWVCEKQTGVSHLQHWSWNYIAWCRITDGVRSSNELVDTVKCVLHLSSWRRLQACSWNSGPKAFRNHNAMIQHATSLYIFEDNEAAIQHLSKRQKSYNASCITHTSCWFGLT